MSLSLGVRTGGQIKIGDDMLTVSSVARDGLTVRVNVRGREYQLSDEEKTEVLPDVYVFCGVSAHTPWGLPFRSKLAFDAPRVIQIDRIQIDRTKENSGMPLKLSAQANAWLVKRRSPRKSWTSWSVVRRL
jgi:sRNA-binding carbon storage regulator CsrA